MGGELSGPNRRTLSGVSTDTRDPLEGQLFVALVGERFDAHDFLHKAIDGGAAGLLVERGRAGEAPEGVAVIEVDDTLFALGELARAHRRRLGTPVVALTGSNGKTTTKELLAGILSRSNATLKTQGNLNNLIGVPMTVLGIEASHAVAVVEMGMNQPGEIARYTEICEPAVGMVINVGPAHIGELGSIEAIAAAKGELYAGLSAGAVRVVSADDERVVKVAGPGGRTFGRAADADVRLVSTDAVGVERQRVELSIDGRALTVEIPFPGAHNAMNATAAVAAATAAPVTVSDDDIVEGLAAVAPVARRLVPRQIGPYLVIDDCYNANGASMVAALETVAARGARFGALLGEMRELGAHSVAEHRRVGEAAVRLGAAFVVTFGPEAKAIADGAAGTSTHHEDDDLDAAFAALTARLEDGDVLLVKGSRGIRMERFIDRLEAQA